jgi:hypothetical protein
MEALNITIAYSSQEGTRKARFYRFEKRIFLERIPQIECHLELENDAIQLIRFNDPVYNIDTDEWSITDTTSENVGRYYQGNRDELMAPVIERFKKHGWSVTKVQ